MTNPFPKVELLAQQTLGDSDSAGQVQLSAGGLGSFQSMDISVLKIQVDANNIGMPVVNAPFTITGVVSSDTTQQPEAFSMSFQLSSDCQPGNSNAIFVHMARINTSINLVVPVNASLSKSSSDTVVSELTVAYSGLPKGSKVTVMNVFPGSDSWCDYVYALLANDLYVTNR